MGGALFCLPQPGHMCFQCGCELQGVGVLRKQHQIPFLSSNGPQQPPRGWGGGGEPRTLQDWAGAGGNPRLNIPWPRGSRHPPSQPRTALQQCPHSPDSPCPVPTFGDSPTSHDGSPSTTPHPALRGGTRPCSGDAAPVGTRHHEWWWTGGDGEHGALKQQRSCGVQCWKRGGLLPALAFPGTDSAALSSFGRERSFAADAGKPDVPGADSCLLAINMHRTHPPCRQQGCGDLESGTGGGGNAQAHTSGHPTGEQHAAWQRLSTHGTHQSQLLGCPQHPHASTQGTRTGSPGGQLGAGGWQQWGCGGICSCSKAAL